MTDERKAIETAAYGEPILFVPRHWTLYEWVKEQPGKSLRNKLYGVVRRAYEADYAKRAAEAERRAYATLDPGERLTALCEAMGHHSQAGNHKRYDELHRMLWSEYGSNFTIERAEPAPAGGEG